MTGHPTKFKKIYITNLQQRETLNMFSKANRIIDWKVLSKDSILVEYLEGLDDARS